MSLTLHLATTNELLERARYVREQVFTIEKQIPKSIEVDELDCLNDECDHFVVEIKDAKELGLVEEINKDMFDILGLPDDEIIISIIWCMIYFGYCYPLDKLFRDNKMFVYTSSPERLEIIEVDEYEIIGKKVIRLRF